MKNSNSMSQTLERLKSELTLTFPYWASLLLLVAAFSDIEIKHYKAFLVFLFCLVVYFQESMVSKFPKWFVYTGRFLFLVLTLLALLYNPVISLTNR